MLNTKVRVIKIEYLDKIRLYLKDIINDLKKSKTWKIKLTITIKSV